MTSGESEAITEGTALSEGETAAASTTGTGRGADGDGGILVAYFQYRKYRGSSRSDRGADRRNAGRNPESSGIWGSAVRGRGRNSGGNPA